MLIIKFCLSVQFQGAKLVIFLVLLFYNFIFNYYRECSHKNNTFAANF